MIELATTPIGYLELVETYVYYDGLKLFLCKSKIGINYLVNLINEDKFSEKWFYIPISSERLNQLRSGQISVYSCTKEAEDGWLFSIMNPKNDKGALEVNFRKTAELLPDELPDEDSYFIV